MKAIATAFPRTGTVEMLSYQGQLYTYYPARYGFEGFYFKPNPVAPVKRVADYILVKDTEGDIELQESYTFDIKQHKVSSVKVQELELSLFTYSIASEKPTYSLIRIEDIIATIKVKIVNGILDKGYYYRTTPSWMIAVKKKVAALHPDLHVAISDGRYKQIEVSRLLKVNIQNIQIGKTAVTTSIKETSKRIKRKTEETEITEESEETEDGRLKGFIEMLKDP